ncbi:DEAD/DEAH box helicase [Kaarinaea lacus]
MSFQSLGLRAEIVRAVSEKGYSEPTPIQMKAIPTVLEQRDLMAGAQTGTGKTAGFTLPLLQRIMETNEASGNKPGKKRPVVRALVLTPTRELAAQVQESIVNYSKYLPLRSAAIFGGVKIGPQMKKLRNGVDIVVATPGRLLDHVNQNTVNLSTVDILVLDEADRMLDMGFMPDIRKLMKRLPREKQTLLFSATFSPEITRLANEWLKSPALIEVAQQNSTAERVSQVVHPVDKNRKRELLSYLIGSNNWQQVLVFTRTKHGADNLSKHLITSGIRATAIHGNKSQGARSKALSDFKGGKARVLVATDIAARGLDISQLPHVVNYELPSTPEDYIHRIGRTGRAGNEGEAMSLVCVDELKLLRDIERLIKRDISKVVIDDFEPDLSIKPEPIHRGRGGKPQSRKQGGKQAGKKRSAPSGNKESSGKKSSSKASGNSSRKNSKSGRKQQGSANNNSSFKGRSGSQRRSHSRAQVSA